MNSQRVILVVEDTDEDVELLQIAIREAGVQNPIQVVRDGQQAIDYLRGSGVFTDRTLYPFPGAVLLDLKLPKLTGFDVLSWLKQHEACRIIPVMVLTSSGLPQDVGKAYLMGANSFMVKPNTLNELVEMVDVAFRFWSMCQIPNVPAKC